MHQKFLHRRTLEYLTINSFPQSKARSVNGTSPDALLSIFKHQFRAWTALKITTRGSTVLSRIAKRLPARQP